MNRSIGFRAQPDRRTSGGAGRRGGRNAQCDAAGGTPGRSPAIRLAPWSIQSWSRPISASPNGGRFSGIRSPAPSPAQREDQRALLAVARDDRRPALAPLERGRGRIEPKPAPRPGRAVTRHAVAGEERLHLPRIIDPRAGPRARRSIPAGSRAPGDERQPDRKAPGRDHEPTPGVHATDRL